MKDRFKFRVWDKENNKYIDFEDWKRFDVEFNFNPETNEIWCEFDHSRYVVEQSTGLKDKNGKLIYEGDILQDCEQKINVVSDEENHCFMFKYQKTHAYKPICCLDVIDGDFEVIGNIHETEKE